MYGDDHRKKNRGQVACMSRYGAIFLRAHLSLHAFFSFFFSCGNNSIPHISSCTSYFFWPGIPPREHWERCMFSLLFSQFIVYSSSKCPKLAVRARASCSFPFFATPDPFPCSEAPTRSPTERSYRAILFLMRSGRACAPRARLIACCFKLVEPFLNFMKGLTKKRSVISAWSFLECSEDPPRHRLSDPTIEFRGTLIHSGDLALRLAT